MSPSQVIPFAGTSTQELGQTLGTTTSTTHRNTRNHQSTQRRPSSGGGSRTARSTVSYSPHRKTSLKAASHTMTSNAASVSTSSNATPAPPKCPLDDGMVKTLYNKFSKNNNGFRRSDFVKLMTSIRQAPANNSFELDSNMTLEDAMQVKR